MIKIGFKTLQLLAIIIALCLVGGQCDSFNALLTCQKCKMSCAVANCYRLAAAGYDQETCPKTACELTYNASVIVDKCAYDHEGMACSTNVCIYPSMKSICASNVLGITSCPSAFLYTQSCATCTNASACAFCRVETTNTSSTKTETCLGDRCNGIDNYTGYVYACTRDAYGGPCSCCLNVTTSVNRAPGICSADNAYTSNIGFFNYAYNKTQFNSTSVSAEFHAMISFIMLFCLLFFAS